MRAAVVCVVLSIGCQAKDSPPPPPKPAITAAECGLFLTKARPTIEALAKRTGMAYTKQIEDSALKDCVNDVAAGQPMLLPRCVLDARSEAAVHACFPTYDAVMTGKTP